MNDVISNTISILGVSISRLGLAAALDKCTQMASEERGGYACFVNVHSLTESRSSADLRVCLNGASFAFADGMPLVWVSRYYGKPVESRVCGPDFMREFLTQNQSLVQGFIGGAPGRAEELVQKFGVQGITYSPPVRAFSSENAQEDWKCFLESCPEGKAPSIVWVGLGAPKQEFWMKEVSPLAPKTLFFGVGAAFDFLTGTTARAPVWMQKSGLEWCFRLAQEPGRLWRRYLGTNTRFILELIRDGLGRSQ